MISSAAAAVDVDLEINLGEHRLDASLVDGRGVDREHRREGIGVLPGHDPQQRVALRLVGALIDERERFAIAFVDRARPFEDGGDAQSVEPRVAMMALVDLDPSDGVAMALVGQRIELAIAAIVQVQLTSSRPLNSHIAMIDSWWTRPAIA